jgi:actin-related protein 8
MFLPSVMLKSEKMPPRHGIIPRSTDLYDGSFNDQEVFLWPFHLTGQSGAQNAMANHWQIPVIQPAETDQPKAINGNGIATEVPTPSRRPSPSIQSAAGDVPESVVDASRRSASPAAAPSPAPGPNGALSTSQADKINRAPTPSQGQSNYVPPTNQAYDDELTVANIPSLEYAIATSIKFASLPALSSMTTTNLGEDRSRRLYSSILVVGSGALVPGIGYMLEDRVRSLKGGTVSVIPPPRDIDPGVLVWKGASVYARLKSAEREAFMTRKEWDLYNVRGIPLRILFVF